MFIKGGYYFGYWLVLITTIDHIPDIVLCVCRCLGYNETHYRVGDCGSISPCGGAAQSVCGVGSGDKCLPNRHVCISPGLEMAADCTQYTCGE